MPALPLHVTGPIWRWSERDGQEVASRDPCLGGLKSAVMRGGVEAAGVRLRLSLFGGGGGVGGVHENTHTNNTVFPTSEVKTLYCGIQVELLINQQAKGQEEEEKGEK